MVKLSRFVPTFLLAAGLSMTGTACAVHTGYYDRQSDYRGDRRAYDIGYREGFEHGQRDAQRGRDFAYAHDSSYRDADDGYRRSFGDIEIYSRTFARATHGATPKRIGGLAGAVSIAIGRVVMVSRAIPIASGICPGGPTRGRKTPQRSGRITLSGR